MSNKIEISLIIPFYKRLDFLSLIFQGINQQSFKEFEVIVAEDNDAPETIEFIKEQQTKSFFPIQHISQLDTGFNKSKAMNKAVAKAKGSFIVFIDGDCIPHKHCLKQYFLNKEDDYVLFGRRVMLSKAITDRLIKKDSIKEINLMNLVLSGSKRVEDSIYMPFRKYKKDAYRGICGCNWGVTKELIEKVNGFDEDYLHATAAEDTDIEWRLRKIGANLRKMKNKSVVYHLHHPVNYSKEQVEENKILLVKKMKKGEPVCKHGIKNLVAR